MGVPTHLSFEDWVCFIFDHPPEGPEWYVDVDAPYWNAPAGLTAGYVTRLFNDPCPPLQGLTDEELNKGFWYMISPGLGEHMLCLDEPELAIATREAVVRSCEKLFRELFLPRCSPHLSHSNGAGAAPLNSICYMWWDVMPVYGGPNPQDQAPPGSSGDHGSDPQHGQHRLPGERTSRPGALAQPVPRGD